MQNLTKISIYTIDDQEFEKKLFEDLLHIKSLTELSVIGNENFHQFVEDFGTFEKLEKLELPRCNLKYLPESLKNLKNLKYLNLNQNKLSPGNLEDILENFEQLETLYLDSNANVTEVPSFLVNLEKLKNLSLSYTGITRVPETMIYFFLKLDSFKFFYYGTIPHTSDENGYISMSELKEIMGKKFHTSFQIL